MFDSIQKLNLVFGRYDDGFIASLIECNRELLSELVLTAASNNYWVSSYARDILTKGMDQDISYLELITVNDWAILLYGKYSSKFPYDHINYVYGWVFDLININDDNGLHSLSKYFDTYSNNRQAILACERYITKINQLIPNFSINIWQYLVQFSKGKQLAIDSLHRYSALNQKKIKLFLNAYR